MVNNHGRTDLLVALVGDDVFHLEQFEDFINRRVLPGACQSSV